MTTDLLQPRASEFKGPKRTRSASEDHQISQKLPLVLLLASALVLLIPNNATLFFSSFLASLVVVRILYLQVFRGARLRFMWILSTGLLLGYGLGTFNTSAQMMFEGWSVSRLTSHDETALCSGLAVSLAVCAAMYFIGSIIETPISLSWKLQASDQILLWTGLLLVAVAYLTGGIGYMGADSTEEHRVSPIAEFAMLFLPILPALTVLIIRRQFRGRSLLLWVLLGIEYVALLPQGRRALLYSMVLFLMALTFTGARIKLARSNTIFVLLAAGLTFYFGNKLFYAMRFERNQAGHKTAIGLIDNIKNAAGIVLSGDERYTASLNTNLRDRTLVLGYFSDLLAASWSHEPLWGRAALFNIRLSVPSVLDRNKFTVTDMGQEENFVNPEFGLKARDEANSIMTTGVADFGVVGCFAYPILISLSMAGLFRICTKRLPDAVRLFTFLSLAYVMLSTEVSTSAFFVTGRNLVIVGVGLVLLEKFPKSIIQPRKEIGKPLRVRRRTLLRGAFVFVLAVLLRPSDDSITDGKRNLLERLDPNCGKQGSPCRGAFQNAVSMLDQSHGGNVELPATTFVFDFPESPRS
jgi:hypothetical protein